MACDRKKKKKMRKYVKRSGARGESEMKASEMAFELNPKTNIFLKIVTFSTKSFVGFPFIWLMP